MAKIKRSQVQTFLNTTPSTTATYNVIGEGVVSGKISYNPKVSDVVYVDDDSATITVDRYGPNMPVEMTCYTGDAVFEYIDGLRIARAVLDACETDVVNVWMYEAGGPTAYPAEKQAVSVQIDDFGGEGGVAVKLNFTLNYQGDPVPGTFNASTKAFTPS